jgi:hypothetical protein
MQICSMLPRWLSRAGLAAENVSAGLYSNHPPVNDSYGAPPERIVRSPGTPQIEFLDALDLNPGQRHCDKFSGA